MARFLALVQEESSDLTSLEEVWFQPDPDEHGIARYGTAAQLGYEASTVLGITASGDGFRFSKRVLLPLLGRTAYGEFSQYLRGDSWFVEHPEAVLQDEYIGLAGAWMFRSGLYLSRPW